MGNLVGVGGLTNVGPVSGDTLAEITDLTVAVWSLTITGLVIGLVGALGFVSMVGESVDKSGERRFGRMLNLDAEARKLAGMGVDYDAFMELCKAKGHEDMSDESKRQVFDECDTDGNGKLDVKEIDVVLQKLKAHETTAKEAAAAKRDSTLKELNARQQGMDDKLDQIVQTMLEQATQINALISLKRRKSRSQASGGSLASLVKDHEASAPLGPVIKSSRTKKTTSFYEDEEDKQ